jgi:hypothetical protein
MLGVLDVNPGTGYFSIPDPGSNKQHKIQKKSQVLKFTRIFNPKNVYYAPGWIQGSKKNKKIVGTLAT